MTPRRFPGLLLVACAAALAWACVEALEGRAAPAEEEYDRPWAGFVPGDASGDLWARVLDASTGAPVEGALLVQHDESCWEGDYLRASVLAAAVTDATGLAHVPRPKEMYDAHWVVRAPGYAPRCEWGKEPPHEVWLRRGEAAALRVLDPWGAPAEGARVEWFDGCSHAPTLEEAVTDACGVARFACIDPGGGELFVTSPRGGSFDGPVTADRVWNLGARVPDLVLHAGPAPSGVVVDLLGRPVPATLLRNGNTGRGPAVLTGRDGRFSLPAIPRCGSLWVNPAVLYADHVPSLRDTAFERPLRVVVTPRGLAIPEWKGARLRVVARGAAPLPSDEALWLRVVRDDGAADSVECRPLAGAAGVLEGVLDVAPGRAHEVVPREGDAYEAAGPSVVVAAGGTATLEVALRARPRLRLRGDIPRRAELCLAFGTTALRFQWDEDDPEKLQVPLPACASAALRIADAAGGVHVVPVGPACGGWREAVVALPPAHRVRWARGEAPRRWELRWRGRPQVDAETEDGFRTRACGDLVLRLWMKDEDSARRIPLALPADAAREVLVDPRRAPVVPDEVGATLRVVPPAGHEGKASFRVDFRGGGSWGSLKDGVLVDLAPGSLVTVTLPGHATRRLRVEGLEAREVRWGASSLDLAVVDEEGEPVEARVVLDDEPYPAPEGRLRLAGLDAGTHRLLVAPSDADDGAREVRIVLKEGEARTQRVTLGPR